LDALPDHEARTVQQFIEFVLMRSRAHPDPEDSQVTLEEAGAVIPATTRRLRTLIHEGVIPAHKRHGRWFIKTNDLQSLLTPEAREFLSHPLENDDLTADQKARSEEGWREHLSGKATPLDELMEKPCHESPKD
jgi:hypothetical protein